MNSWRDNLYSEILTPKTEFRWGACNFLCLNFSGWRQDISSGPDDGTKRFFSSKKKNTNQRLVIFLAVHLKNFRLNFFGVTHLWLWEYECDVWNFAKLMAIVWLSKKPGSVSSVSLEQLWFFLPFISLTNLPQAKDELMRFQRTNCETMIGS